MRINKLPSLVGRRFGRLVVFKEAPPREYSDGYARRWYVQCDCGKKTASFQGSLISGRATSCGCHREARKIKHGMSYSAEYRVWHGMIGRCHNPNDPSYSRYGERGITVCLEWRNAFTEFYSSMGRRPSAKHSIDRINNDGNYEPGNCRWATLEVQAGNKSTNRLITWRGETRCVAEWARLARLSRKVFLRKISNGIALDDILPNPA